MGIQLRREQQFAAGLQRKPVSDAWSLRKWPPVMKVRLLYVLAMVLFVATVLFTGLIATYVSAFAALIFVWYGLWIWFVFWLKCPSCKSSAIPRWRILFHPFPPGKCGNCDQEF